MLADQLRNAFTSFTARYPSTFAHAREREIVSRFAFCHLVPTIRPGEVLCDLAQLGLEVAVPQRRDRPNPRTDPDVCKDIVIWPRPDMICWDASGRAVHFPRSVIEWKTINRKDRPDAAIRKRDQGYAADIEWLRWFVSAAPGAEGYAVLADVRTIPIQLHVCRITTEGEDFGWFATGDVP